MSVAAPSEGSRRTRQAIGPGASVGTRTAASRSGRPRKKIAYVMSRFPKISETFILFEILAMQEQGFDVELYPLQRERGPVIHPEAARLVSKAHYQPFVAPGMVASHARFLLRAPRQYAATLWTLLRAAWGSPKFLAGVIVFFPKIGHMARLMEQAGVDHVHCHFASHPAAAGFAIHRLTGIPFSFTAHGSDLHVDRHMLCEKLAEAAFVVAISNDNRQVIERECGEPWRQNIAVIHTGVDTSLFRPAEARREGPFRIVCVGRLIEVKGQQNLIEACRSLAAAGVDFRCQLVGEGPDRRMLGQRIAQAGLTDRVVLLGARSRNEVVELIRGADVVVASSVPTRSGSREGIPVALMEAMSAAVPVVASDISGIPELVDDGVSGVLVPPGDPGAIGNALLRLHADPAERRRMGEAGREKVLREFDLRANTAQLAQRFAA